MWQGEDFFGRNIGCELDARMGDGASARPDMTARQTDGEIGAGRVIAQFRVLFVIELIPPGRQLPQVRLPCGDRIRLCDPTDLEDGFP